jgi:flagellar basal body P-ring formation protein FlgA
MMMKLLNLTPIVKSRHLFLVTAATCVGLIALTVAAARAQDAAPRLKPIITVDHDVVRLGDLIEGAGKNANIALFGAPKPGTSGMISTTRILNAARESGLIEIETNGLSSVAVRRLGRLINADEISRAVSEALAKQHQVPTNAEIEFNAGQMEVTVESGATEPVQIRSISYNGASGRFEAIYSVPGSRALEVEPAKVIGSIADVVRVPVLTRAILKGDVVTTSDFTLERRRRSDLGQDVTGDVAKLVGNSAKRALPKGLVLRESDVQRTEVVERNANVIMFHNQPGIQLTMRGKAQQAGAIGDTITVQNINSKRLVEATITAPGTVTVTGVVLPQKTARNGSQVQ